MTGQGLKQDSNTHTNVDKKKHMEGDQSNSTCPIGRRNL